MSNKNTQLITTDYIGYVNDLLADYDSIPEKCSLAIRRENSYSLFPYIPPNTRLVIEEEEIEITMSLKTLKSLPYKYTKNINYKTKY